MNNLIWIKTEVTCHKISRFKPFHLGFNTGFISSSFCWFSRWVVVHTSVKCGPKTYGCQIACKVSELWHEHLLTQLKLPEECLYDLSFILAHWAQGAENESHKPSTGSVKKTLPSPQQNITALTRWWSFYTQVMNIWKAGIPRNVGDSFQK